MQERPLVTVFTPSHRNTYLDECFTAMLNQTYQNWEWIVLLNGGSRWRPPVQDDRIRLIETPEVAGVGAAKQMACAIAKGEYLIEYDHDDILTPNAVAEVVFAFLERPDVGLVFSHFAQIRADGSRCDERFNEAMGWTYEDVEINGKNFLQVQQFEQFPSTVSYIWFAPNHVRAFRRSSYEEVGGYDPTLDILDDQDLMCRLYERFDFHLIDECLYLQRIHEHNTQLDPETNARIQQMTVELYDRYVERNALAWARRRGLVALDFGAAHRKAPGYLGVDIHSGDGVDIVADLTQGLDMADGSVGVIRAVDFLGHITDKVAIFNEIYRLLAHGGMLISLTPSTDGRGAFQDPTHVAFYNENSFWYFANSQYRAFVPSIACRFQVSRLVTFYPDDWHEQNFISYVNANLVAVKSGPRIAGALHV